MKRRKVITWNRGSPGPLIFAVLSIPETLASVKISKVKYVIWSA